jgi:hypothetical protein
MNKKGKYTKKNVVGNMLKRRIIEDPRRINPIILNPKVFSLNSILLYNTR